MGALPVTSSRMLRVDLSTEVREPQNPLSIAVQSPEDAPLATINLDAVISLALARAGLSHDQACAHMGGLDASLWARQRQGKDNAHVSVQRLTKLPRTFWLELLQQMAEPLGIVIAHPDLADRLTNQLLLSVQCSAQLAQQERALRAGGRR